MPSHLRPTLPARRCLNLGLPCVLGLLGAGSLGLTGCSHSDPASSLVVRWDVASAAAPSTVRQCTDVGVANIVLDVGAGGSYKFPCTSFGGQTSAISSGYYNVQVIAEGTGDKPLQATSFQNYYIFGLVSLPTIHFIIP